MKYTKVSGDSITFICANSEIYLEDFFVDCPPTIFYADNSMSYGIKYCKPKRKAEEIPNSMISTLTWEGVDLSKNPKNQLRIVLILYNIIWYKLLLTNMII